MRPRWVAAPTPSTAREAGTARSAPWRQNSGEGHLRDPDPSSRPTRRRVRCRTGDESIFKPVQTALGSSLCPPDSARRSVVHPSFGAPEIVGDEAVPDAMLSHWNSNGPRRLKSGATDSGGLRSDVPGTELRERKIMLTTSSNQRGSGHLAGRTAGQGADIHSGACRWAKSPVSQLSLGSIAPGNDRSIRNR